MSSITFGQAVEKAEGKAAAVAVETEVVKDPVALAPATQPAASTSVSTRVNEGGVSGEVGDDDISVPRVRLIQGTGKFSSLAPLGSITIGFDDLLMVAKEGVPVQFVVGTAHKQFQQKTVWGGNEVAKVFDTAAEVAEAGGQIQNARGAGFYDSIAHFRMFLGVPEGDLEKLLKKEARAREEGEEPDGPSQAELMEQLFPFKWNGMLWAPCVHTSSGMSYSSFAKSIFTAQRYSLKNLWDGVFEMHSTEVPTAFGPKKKLNARFVRKWNDGELQEFLTNVATK